MCKMIKFNFLLHDNSYINQEMFKQNTYLLEYYIEGELEIYIGNEIWFSEDYFNLIELAVGLKSWVNLLKINDTNFSFKSVDSNDIIFNFKRIENNWEIYSPWQNYIVMHDIELLELLNAIEEYLNELENELIKKFNIKLFDYYRK